MTEGIVTAPKQKVYFIGGDDGPIKIGRSENPLSRLRTLQCASPVKLRILAECPHDAIPETMWHGWFAEDRLIGEWFKRSDRLMGIIEGLRRDPIRLRIPKKRTAPARNDGLTTRREVRNG
jgi:hypothetical protein